MPDEYLDQENLDVIQDPEEPVQENYVENFIQDVSGNPEYLINYTSNNIELETIEENLSLINETLSSMYEDSLEPMPLMVGSPFSPADGSVDGYFLKDGNNFVYVPVDRVQYLSVKPNGQVINLSSSTITCYSLDSNGNTISQYRFPSFGTCEKYVQVGSYYQWQMVTVTDSGSNITFGQTGIHSFEGVLLFGILLLVGVIALFRRH